MERYNEYKDSGVQWLGEIPSHWEVCKVKHHYKMITGFTPSTGKSKYYSNNSDNTWVTIADMKTKFISESSSHISDLYIKNFKPTIVPKGSLLYSFKLSVGQVAFADKDLYTNEAIASFENNENVCLDFLFYSASLCIIKNANTNIYGAFILNQELIKNATIVYPPFAEQKAIANYLDSATSKIDEAIAQKQKMIDLLNERKQIIINNAVTKGLNPDAPMKDSGVDWIGEIPEHWIITKLKHLVEITDGTHDTPRYVDPSSNTYPLVTSRCIVNGVIDLSLANHITEQDYNYIATRSYVRRNDVIMPMIGTVGNPAIVDFEDSIAIKNVALFRTNGDINIAKFLKYLLNSSVVKEQFAMYNKGGVQNFVSQEILKNLAIIVPDNITDIVGFLEREIAKIETPIIAHNQQISLLQERKQIIINDVVTGKVKVS